MLEVKLGHPAPGVINTVNWPFRLGLGDRPTICHHKKKKAVRKPEMWPRNIETEWERSYNRADHEFIREARVAKDYSAV